MTKTLNLREEWHEIATRLDDLYAEAEKIQMGWQDPRLAAIWQEIHRLRGRIAEIVALGGTFDDPPGSPSP